MMSIPVAGKGVAVFPPHPQFSDAAGVIGYVQKAGVVVHAVVSTNDGFAAVVNDVGKRNGSFFRTDALLCGEQFVCGQNLMSIVYISPTAQALCEHGIPMRMGTSGLTLEYCSAELETLRATSEEQMQTTHKLQGQLTRLEHQKRQTEADHQQRQAQLKQQLKQRVEELMMQRELQLKEQLNELNNQHKKEIARKQQQKQETQKKCKKEIATLRREQNVLVASNRAIRKKVKDTQNALFCHLLRQRPLCRWASLVARATEHSKAASFVAADADGNELSDASTVTLSPRASPTPTDYIWDGAKTKKKKKKKKKQQITNNGGGDNFADILAEHAKEYELEDRLGRRVASLQQQVDKLLAAAGESRKQLGDPTLVAVYIRTIVRYLNRSHASAKAALDLPAEHVFELKDVLRLLQHLTASTQSLQLQNASMTSRLRKMSAQLQKVTECKSRAPVYLFETTAITKEDLAQEVWSADHQNRVAHSMLCSSCDKQEGSFLDKLLAEYEINPLDALQVVRNCICRMVEEHKQNKLPGIANKLIAVKCGEEAESGEEGATRSPFTSVGKFREEVHRRVLKHPDIILSEKVFMIKVGHLIDRENADLITEDLKSGLRGCLQRYVTEHLSQHTIIDQLGAHCNAVRFLQSHADLLPDAMHQQQTPFNIRSLRARFRGVGHKTMAVVLHSLLKGRCGEQWLAKGLNTPQQQQKKILDDLLRDEDYEMMFGQSVRDPTTAVNIIRVYFERVEAHPERKQLDTKALVEALCECQKKVTEEKDSPRVRFVVEDICKSVALIERDPVSFAAQDYSDIEDLIACNRDQSFLKHLNSHARLMMAGFANQHIEEVFREGKMRAALVSMFGVHLSMRTVVLVGQLMWIIRSTETCGTLIEFRGKLVKHATSPLWNSPTVDRGDGRYEVKEIISPGSKY
jgi:hypothetical protein